MKYSEIFKMICSAKYKTVGDFVDYCVFFNEEDKKIYCLFEPSNQKRDWINNFNFPVKLYKNQQNKFYVARGWGNAYKSCNDLIMQEVIDLCYEKEFIQVVFAGWSYGGALAQLAAEDFNFRTSLFPEVVTFGSPKPLFGKKSLEHFRYSVLECINLEHVNDCVPILPPFAGYHCLNSVKVGFFVPFGFFNPMKWHCRYFEEGLYEGLPLLE